MRHDSACRSRGPAASDHVKEDKQVSALASVQALPIPARKGYLTDSQRSALTVGLTEFASSLSSHQADFAMYCEHFDAANECVHGSLPHDRRIMCECWDMLPGVALRRQAANAKPKRTAVKRAA